MKKHSYFFLFTLGVLCFVKTGWSQVNLPDSLRYAADKEKSSYYNLLAKQHPNMDSAIFYTHKAIEFSSKCDCDSMTLLNHYNLALFPAIHGEFDLAIANTRFIDSLIALEENAYYTYRRQTLLAYAYKMKSRLDKSLELYKSALETTMLMNDPVLIAEAQNNVGDAFAHMEFYDEARSYFLLALEYYNSTESSQHRERKHIIYKNLISASQNDDEIENYANKAFELIEKDDNPQVEVLLHLNIANAYNRLESFSKSKIASRKAFESADQIDYTLVKNIALLNWGVANLGLNEPRQAVIHLEQALELEQPSVHNHHLILKSLSTAYADIREYKKAFDVNEKASVLTDSMNRMKSTEAFAEFDVKFKTEQKDKKIAEQQLDLERQKNIQNQTIFGSILTLLLLGVISLFLYYKNQMKKRESDMALQLSEAEANKLRDLDSLKSRFFTNISHELRTPLSLITGPLQEVLDKTDQNGIKNDVKLAHSNSKKLLGLVNEILDLSKLENGKLDVNTSNIQLYSYLKRIFYSFESLASIQKIELEFEYLLPQDIVVKTDIDKCEKIINNLLANAIKYNQPNGTVKMLVEQAEGQLHLTVSDTGGGISEEELPRIFNRFYQVGSSDTPMLGGTGIGLALARELARLLSGDIRVQSEQGEGSQFLFTTPLVEGKLLKNGHQSHDAEIAKAAVVPIYESLLINGNKPRVLIVEDHLEMSQYLKKLLEESYRCDLAANGKIALGKVSRQQYDLIISDVMMPVMTGFEFKKQFNKLRGYKYTPFIMLTARVLQEDRLTGFKLGVDDYITKPFEKTELLARVHNLIKNKIEREQWQKPSVKEDKLDLSVEEKLLQTAESIILDNLDNTDFKVTDLAKSLAYSQRQLARIIKKLTGMTVVGFILELRLQKAYQLIKNKQFHSITEVMYQVGIESPSYFSSKFTERFGCNPKNVS